VKRDSTSDLTFTILVGYTLSKAFLLFKLYTVLRDVANKRTFVKTAMDAYEFPKLMPTILGTAEISIGASAVPFGMIPFGAIVLWSFRKDQGYEDGLIKILHSAWQKKSGACERKLYYFYFIR
jgi:hypothetical protein